MDALIMAILLEKMDRADRDCGLWTVNENFKHINWVSNASDFK